MGMFDKPKYLTGDEGFADAGDVIWLHNAKLDGTTTVNGSQRDQVKLLVSRERDGEKTAVYTSGVGIVNQIKRMDASDRAAFPMEVRLDQIPSGKGNPTNVLTPASEDAPVGASAGGGDDF